MASKFFTVSVSFDGLTSGILGMGCGTYTRMAKSPAKALQAIVAAIEAEHGQSVLPQRMSLRIENPYGKVISEWSGARHKGAEFYPFCNREGFLLPASCVPDFAPHSLQWEILQDMRRSFMGLSPKRRWWE